MDTDCSALKASVGAGAGRRGEMGDVCNTGNNKNKFKKFL